MTDEKFDAQGTLLNAVVTLLKDKREKDFLTIFKETGIPYFWIRKIANGDIKNPSVNRIQHLYEYLTGKELGV